MKEIIERANMRRYRSYFDYNQIKWHQLTDEHLYIELCFIQKWLREVHLINIEIKSGEWDCKVYSLARLFISINIYGSESYEKALEEGIKKALEILERL